MAVHNETFAKEESLLMKAMMRRSGLFLCAWVCGAVFCRADDPMPGDIISYDPTNFLSYEMGSGGGVPIRLLLTRDGTESTWDLSSAREFVAIRIFDMKYADKGMLWVESRLGRRVNAAVLLDLDARAVVKAYAGHSYFLSPDRWHMAWIENWGRYAEEPRTMYIDDVMVFPQVKHYEFRRAFPTQESSASAPILSFRDDVKVWRINPREVYWTSDSSIEFLVSEDWDYENNRNRGKYFRYRVSDFLVQEDDGKSRVDAEKVKVEGFEIQNNSDAHAVALFRSAIQDQTR